MSNANFKTDFAKLLAGAGKDAQTVVRLAALELQTMMIESSPVDTGRFKGNWQAGLGSINTTTGSSEDKTPLGQSDESNVDRSRKFLLNYKIGQTIFLSNSMPYASVLEYGRANGKPGSIQAPGGMVRLAVQNYSQAVAKAVSELKT